MTDLETESPGEKIVRAPTRRPSVGRIVIYHDGDAGDDRAAIITRVWSDECVNLAVFEDHFDAGGFGGRNKVSRWTSVMLGIPGSLVGHCWYWPSRT